MCTCIVYVCVHVCVWACLCVCACVCMETKGLSLFLPLTPSILSSEITYLTELEVRHQTGGPESPRDPSVSGPPTLGFQTLLHPTFT